MANFRKFATWAVYLLLLIAPNIYFLLAKDTSSAGRMQAGAFLVIIGVFLAVAAYQ